MLIPFYGIVAIFVTTLPITAALAHFGSTNLAASLRNLLSGSLARRWVEDAKEQLELRLMALSGSVLQDGGEPAPDYAEHVPTDDWKRLVEQFLLTQGYER